MRVLQWDARGLQLGTQPGSVYGEESRVESFLSGVRAWFFWKARAGASAVASGARYFSRKPRGTRNMAFNIPRISSGFGTRVCDESSRGEARPREGRTTGRISTIDHAPALGLTLTLFARPRSRSVASTRPVLFRLSLLAPSANLRCTHVAFLVRVRFSLYRNDLASSCVSLFHRLVFSFLPSLRVSSMPNRTRSFLSYPISLPFSHRFSSYRFYVSRVS